MGYDEEPVHGEYPIGAHPESPAAVSWGERQPAPKGSRLAAAEARAERHRIEMERAQAELARLEALPPEPDVELGEPNVIWFKKRFKNGGVDYDYAACKGNNGLWYTTGPSSPKGYTWQALIEWIHDGDAAEVWHVSGLDPLE